MQYLQKTWIRVLVSLFLGGAVSELIHITTGDPNRPQETNLSLVYAIFLYLIFTFFFRQNGKGTDIKNEK
jgi:hypothetical protein